MPRAFILFNVESGSEDKVLAELKRIEGIQEVYVSYGVYDIIAKLKAENMQMLKDTVTHKMRTIKNVRSTLTLIMTEE